MKISILSIISLMVFISCSSNTKELGNSNTVEVSEVDTAAISASKIAYGKVKFGITKKEFDKIMPEPFEGIAGQMFKVSASFDDGKLYLIDFLSLPKQANYIESSLKPSIEEFAELITEKYGEPSEDYGEINFFDLKPEKVANRYIWNIHTKTIELGIYEEYGGGKYSIYCSIFDQPTLEKLQNEREKKNERSNKL
jgi:hypothetical protein